MRRVRRLLSAAAVGIAVVCAVSACSDGSQVSGRLPDGAASAQAAGLDRWSDAMNAALLDDDHGFGSSSGVGTGGAGTETPGGDWDILVACNGVDGKTIRVYTGPDARDQLVHVDVPCGIVTRLPVTVPRVGGLTVQVRTLPGASEAVRRGEVVSYWYVSIVKTGFEPKSRDYEVG